MAAPLPSVAFPAITDLSEFTRWHPALLMEWAKSGYAGVKHNLAVSGVDHARYDELPGGPFEIVIDGWNVHGHSELRELLAHWYGAQPGQVLIAQGASECNFLVAGAVLSGGGEAIIETPHYEPIYRSVEVWAERIHDLPRRAENNYLPDLSDLKKLLNNNVRLVCLTDLHNPTHVRLPQDLLREIVQLCHNAGAQLMVDEVYLSFIERDHTKHSFSQGSISINSMCKAWGVSNLRVGWAIGDETIIHKAYRLNNLLGVNQPYVSEHLAYQIMRSDEALKFLIARADKAMANRHLLDEFLAATPEITATKPAGGLSAWLKLPAGMDDRALLTKLVTKCETVCFPGYLYGAPGYIRVSFGSDPALMREGFKRLHQAIRDLA